MSTQVYAGLAVTAGTNSAVSQATLDYVSTTQAISSGYLAVAAGGGPVGTYQADEFFSGGQTAQTQSAINLSGVTNPAPMGVYQGERYGTFTYTIPDLTRSATYVVRLHFSENIDSSVGQRIFNVAINGTQVLSNFDILAATGGNMDTAIVEQFSATAASTGQMTIAFSPSTNSPDQNAEVNGIEIIPLNKIAQIFIEPVAGSAVAGQAFTGTLATCVDTDPGGLAGDYIATINWGDGTTSSGSIQPDPSGSGFAVIGSHTYPSSGSYAPKILIQSYQNARAQTTSSMAVSKVLRPRVSFPNGWRDTDVGGPTLAGLAQFTNGVFTVSSSGAGIGGTADQFNYVYQALTGDETIIARVDTVQNTSSSAAAGAMIRQSLDAGSPEAFAMVTPANGVDFLWRSAQNATATSSGSISVDAGAPYWVKLVRAGSTITAYAAPDGQNWAELGAATIPMSTQVYAGLAVTAGTNSAVNQATLDYVSTTQAISAGYLAVAAGGGPVGTYQADEFFSGGQTAQTQSAINLSEVTNPAPMGVYQGERYGTFTYIIPDLTRSATYVVRLHFSENIDSSIGQRIFNVAINGTQVLSNFDILAATGGNMDTAIVEQFSATAASTGQMTIAFSPSTNSPDQNAEVNGIELIPNNPSARFFLEEESSSAVAGQVFTGTLATFDDKDPGGLARDYIATINWGDGTTTIGTIQPDPSGSGFDLVGTHIFTTAGSHWVKFTIQSSDNAHTQDGSTVTVSAAPSAPSLVGQADDVSTPGMTTLATIPLIANVGDAIIPLPPPVSPQVSTTMSPLSRPFAGPRPSPVFLVAKRQLPVQAAHAAATPMGRVELLSRKLISQGSKRP
jgi:hypothetical protein